MKDDPRDIKAAITSFALLGGLLNPIHRTVDRVISRPQDQKPSKR